MWSLISTLILLFLVDCNHRMLDSPPSAVGVIFDQYKLVPSVDKTPDHYMIVVYDNNCHVLLGNKLAQRQVAKAPSASFYACPDRYYTLMLVGPNSPTNRCLRSTNQLYWLGVNIPGDDLTSGHWLATYVAPTQPNSAYTFLVFRQQKGKQNTNVFLDSGYGVNRTCFNVGKIARKWDLYLLAGNFFYLE